MRSIILMYHDVYLTQSAPNIPRSASLYHLSLEAFAAQITSIKESKVPASTVSGLAERNSGDHLVITFDDGWRGAFEFALPLLLRHGLTATFYITRDYVGRENFVDRDGIAQAARAGMEIGAHGTTHRLLSELPDQEVQAEFSECKTFLESIIDGPVISASVPGGDCNARFRSCAGQAGFRTLCTSRPGLVRSGGDLLNLNRIAIRESTSLADIQRYCRFNVRKEKIRSALYQIPHRVLGMKRYSQLRRRLLGE